jgi:hypothetical protein
MYQRPGVTTSPVLPIPDRMKAWMLGDPDQMLLLEKPVPVPARAEVLIRIDAVAICATDLEIIHSGSPANIEGGLPFNKTSRRTAAAEYAVNHINTLARVPDTMSVAEATLVVTAGGIDVALGASPVILTGTRNGRLAIGRELGADRVVNINDEDAVEVVKQLTGGIGADYVVECAGTEGTINQAIHMTNRGGKICLAAFPHDPVTMDLAHLVKNNIYAYGIRGEGRSATRRAMALMAERRFDATKIRTHIFPLADLPTALCPRARRRCNQGRCCQPAGGRDRERGGRIARAGGRPSNFVLDSSQGGQDNLRRQRNLRDNCSERPECVIDRIGYGRRRTCRTCLACAFCSQFRFPGR